jgi:predicted nuclease of predicted toxin-antitoxin system
VTFLVDAQLPFDLATALTTAGHPSKAVRDVGLREAEDEDIWQYAGTNDFCIVTKDEDFANLVWRTTTGPSVVWLRLGNCTNKDLRNRLIPLLDEIALRLAGGDRLIEVW